MKNVKWTDNICTVGGTCIHGYFNGDDLNILLKLCPTGTFTPTFSNEHLDDGGYRNTKLLKEIIISRHESISLYDKEWGYYFIFMENEGNQLLGFLKKSYPMIRGEGCF